MSKASEKAEAKAEAIATLRKMGVKPGATVYTIVTHVARSGMSRHVRCYIVTRNTRHDYQTDTKRTEHGITDITGLVANALGWQRARDRWDIVVHGCGMDMCWHTVYTLGRVMFPKGGSLKHTSGVRARQEEAKGRETDGGYLLRNQSL